MPKKANLTNDFLAKLFLTDRRDGEHLLFVESDNLLYEFDIETNIYKPLPTREFTRTVRRFLSDLKHDPKPAPDGETYLLKPKKNITTALTRDVCDSIIDFLTDNSRLKTKSSNRITFTDRALDLSTSPPKPHTSSPNLPSFIHFKIPLPDPLTPQPPPPLFSKFLNQIFQNNQSLIDYIQLIFGYSLLPTSKAEKAFFFYGDGQNGKSVLIEILRSLFPDHLLASAKLNDITNNEFTAASLAGKQLNCATETKAVKLQSDMFKSIVSGEPVRVSRKYEQAFDLTLNTTFVFAVNSLPSLDGVEMGIRRRLVIIPFDYTVPDSKKDIHLTEKIIKQERDQIIRWAIAGAVKFIKSPNCLTAQLPAECHEAYHKFEEGQSSAVQFFNENIQLTTDKPNSHISISTLYNRYKEYCNLHLGRSPVSQNRFLQELKSTQEPKGLRINRTPSGQWKLSVNSQTKRALAAIKWTDDKTAWINTNYQNNSIKNSKSPAV